MKNTAIKLRQFYIDTLEIENRYNKFSPTPIDAPAMCKELFDAAGIKDYQLRIAADISSPDWQYYTASWKIGDQAFNINFCGAARYDHNNKPCRYELQEVRELVYHIIYSYYLKNCAKDCPGLSFSDVLDLAEGKQFAEVSVQISKKGYIKIPPGPVTEEELKDYIAVHLDHVHFNDSCRPETSDGIVINRSTFSDDLSDGHNL